MNAAIQQETLRKAIEHSARECEKCVRLAQFADSEPCYPEKMGEGLRKLAIYHAENAFAASAKFQAAA